MHYEETCAKRGNDKYNRVGAKRKYSATSDNLKIANTYSQKVENEMIFYVLQPAFFSREQFTGVKNIHVTFALWSFQVPFILKKKNKEKMITYAKF